MALPNGIGYCTITGHFIRTLLDGPDPDRDPDTLPIPGLQISIKADVSKPALRHAPSKTTILMDTIDVTTNANGDLIGKDLIENIKIIAGDNPALGIFTYTATIQGPTYPRQTLTFDAPTGGTRDLSDLIEVPPAPGATLNAWLEAKNTTLAARDEVLAALENGGGGSLDETAVRGVITNTVKGASLISVTPGGNNTLMVGTTATQNAPDASLRTRSTHTGTQSADTIVDGSTNKAYTATEASKLAALPAGATVNSTDASLRTRSTHTGTQLASTISDFTTAANAAIATNLRLPIVLTQLQHDALNPPVPGQIYYIVSEDA